MAGKAKYRLTINRAAYRYSPATIDLIMDSCRPYAIKDSAKDLDDGRNWSIDFASQSKAALAALEILTYVSALTTGDIEIEQLH